MGSTAHQRRSEIVRLVNQSQRARVADLSTQFGVSGVVIRKDLQYLESQGLLTRIHGGAVALNSRGSGSPADLHREQNLEKKARIGKKAAELINPGEIVLFDSGSTTPQVACHIDPHILRQGNLKVITSSLPIVNEIGAYQGIDLILLGGIYLSEYGILVGPQTVEQLKTLHADKMFMGTDGLTFSQGVTTANLLEAETDRYMMKASSEVIVVSDSSKIGVSGLVSIMPITQLHKLITDTDAPPDFVEALRAQGTEVILV